MMSRITIATIEIAIITQLSKMDDIRYIKVVSGDSVIFIVHDDKHQDTRVITSSVAPSGQAEIVTTHYSGGY